MRKPSLPLFLSVAGLSLFLALACCLLFTRAPWWDEGFLAGPSVSLASGGPLGTNILSFRMPMADQYLYWNMPFYFLALAAWFKVFGTSIYAMRCYSLLCALVALAGWYVIVIKLMRDRLAAALTVALLCTDYVFIIASVNGRMDMMNAACGVGGIAAYLWFRETNLKVAVFAGAVGAAGAVFCHPLGLIYAGALFATAMYLDWRRIRIQHVLLAIVPISLGGFAWLAYIMRAPDIFSAHMKIYSNRAHVAWNPIQIISREITGRYLMFYANPAVRDPALPKTAAFKVLGLLPYVAGIVLAFSSRLLWKSTGGRLLLLLAPLAAFLLAIGDYIQSPHYFLHVFPFALALLGTSLALYWQRGTARIFLAGLFCVCAGVGVVGLASKIRANPFRNIYQPMANSVLPYMGAKTVVIGPCELMFALGESRVIDGITLENFYKTKPEIIVTGRFFGYLKELPRPEWYDMTFQNSEYTVYRLKAVRAAGG